MAKTEINVKKNNSKQNKTTAIYKILRRKLKINQHEPNWMNSGALPNCNMSCTHTHTHTHARTRRHQKWLTQKKWQHRVYKKIEKKTKTQYEKLTTQGTQEEDKQDKCVGHHNTQTNTKNVNKT